MFSYILGISFLKVFRPHIRKNVLDNISNGEFIFLNSLFIGILSFVYTYIYKKEDINNITSLTLLQYLALLFLASLTIVSSIFIFILQERGIITETFIMKMISAIMVLVVGVFIYNENITPKQFTGIILGILAILLIKG
jgi:drug/metabolite transporter (DMT)-like permease